MANERRTCRQRRKAGLRKACAIGLTGVAPMAFASGVHAQVGTVEIGQFENPVFVTAAPGFKNLLFVVEQGGVVRVVRKDNQLRRPFLKISGLVRGPGDPGAGGEQGLLSIAFAPDYRSSGLFYVAYTSEKGDLKIEEFKRAANSNRRADRSSRRHLLSVRHRNAQNHNGGQLQFGPDGYLYISTGDGGGGGDPWDNARKKRRLLGKILRINPKATKTAPYRTPRSNPFKGRTGRDEIFAYGLRNPWRFSFHRRKILIADVGQNAWEEINVLGKNKATGANFGWPQYEGLVIYDDDRPGPGPVTFPQLVYDHDGGGCSVTGGYVVTDPALPDLQGRYVYADYCLGDIRSFIPGKTAKDDTSTGLTLPFPTSFGVGPRGGIYVAQASGTVSRLVASSAD